MAYKYKDFIGSIPEIIAHFNLDINKMTIYNRLKKGMTLDEAIEKPIKKLSAYEYRNFIGSIPEIIRHFHLDINKITIYDRMRKGMTIEQAIETPLHYNITTKSEKRVKKLS